MIRSVAQMCFVAVISAQSAIPQTPPDVREPAFEVSVVRLSSPDSSNSNLNLGKDRVQAKGLTMQALLQFAYKLSSGSEDQIVGGPKWMKSVRFDLEGKLDAETTAKVSRMSNEERVETLRGMLRALLVDRFKLNAHVETRTLPVIRMQTMGETKLVRFQAPAAGSVESKGWQGLRNSGQGHIEGRGADLKMLASVLAFQPEVGGRLVIDQTGLPEHERFTFDLKWTPEKLGEGQTETVGASAMSLFTAMQNELGLKLSAGKAPVPVVVVDGVEMPGEN